MNIFGKLQSQYDQLWKYIIRPTRTPYSEDMLGPSAFRLEDQDVQRQDFQITNSRGYTFHGSIWAPRNLQQYNCIVYLHGNSGNRTDGMEYLGKLIKNNLALCSFDFTGSGNAEGEFITLGYYEQEDLRLVIQYLKEIPKVKQLAIWGRSMGAVTAMLYLGKTIEIKGAIFDSPFKNLKCLVEDMSKKNSKIPTFVLAGAIKIISKTIQDKANFSIYNINPLKYSAPGLYYPAFFIVGIDDEVIPPEHTKELYSVYAGQDKQIKLVKGKHNDPRPQDCVNQAVAFLLEKFGHDWKEDIKKTKKEFDFFEMEKIMEKDKLENKSTEDVDFFTQEKNVEEVKKVEESIKKGEFSLSGLFSMFSRENKKEKKQQKQPLPLKDGYEETRATLVKRFSKEETKMAMEDKRIKIQQEQYLKKETAQSSQQQRQNQLKQWVLCTI